MLDSFLLQDLSVNSNKDENKQNMSESSRLSNSGIPKPTAAVKGMTKPTNSVAPMPIVKSEADEKIVVNVNPLTEEKGKEKEALKHVSILRKITLLLRCLSFVQETLGSFKICEF